VPSFAATRRGRKKRLKVAAIFDRAWFDCRACAKEEAHGGDPKGLRSGSPRSCEGPKRYTFSGGAATWTGCPRRALGARETLWLNLHRRTGGKFTATELLHVPMLLVDACDAVDEMVSQAEAHEREVASVRKG
jgi:hypothetical protein